MGLHLAMAATMLATWRIGRRAPAETCRLSLITGVLARLVLIPVAPFTTGDVARYLWDGHVALQGIDPYQVAPIDTPAAVRAAWPPPTDNLTLPTLYPPLALGLFTTAAAAGPQHAFWIWKSLVTLASLATLFFSARLVRRRGCVQHLPLVSLSPLLVLEGGIGAHVDLVATAGVAVALVLQDRDRPAGAAAALATAGLLKPTPLVALAPLVVSAGKRRAARVVLAAALVLGAGYGLAILAGLEPVGSLFLFFRKWRFGSPLFTAAPWTADGAVAVLALPLVAGGLAAALVRARRGFIAGAVWALAGPLVASPVVFPWYLAPVVPVLAVAPRAFLLIWTITLPLTYEVIDTYETTGVWAPARWPLLLVFAGWVVGWMLDVRQRAASSRGVSAPSAAATTTPPK